MPCRERLLRSGMSAFEELGICPEIIQAVEEDDWLLPTAVQQEAIPLILTGGDVLAAAETGSGKTGAFGLPCLQIVHEQLRGKCQMREPTAASTVCRLDTSDKDFPVTVADGGLECRSPDEKLWHGIRATTSVLKGKYMFEVEVVEGMCRVGWSTSSTKLELGNEEGSFGYGSTGKKSNKKKYEDFGEPFEAGDIIGCMLDREKQAVSFAKNGKQLGVAFRISEEVEKEGLKPHVCGKKFNVVMKFEGPMEYPVEGFRAVGEADAEHTIQGDSQPGKGKRPPLCVILEPTRDLAEQTFKNMKKFSAHLDDPAVKLALLVGGTDDADQVRALERGVDICVGTLQKTMDHVRRGKLELSQVKFLVLDEADDLQKKDDRKDIGQLNTMIKSGRRDRVQTLFFSATLHTPEVQQLIGEITHRPVWVDLKGKDAVPETVHQVLYRIDPTAELGWAEEEVAVNAKDPEMQPILDGVHAKASQSDVDKAEEDALRYSEKIKKYKMKMLVKIADMFKMSQVLVFCRTNWDCNNLEAYLNRLGGCKGFKGKFESGKENPYSCVVLAGGRTQKQRQENLESFKEGDVRFLICTDVAARGIDIAGLPFVIQLTLPDDIENYIHRIGRCGRAERMGLAIAFAATEKEKVWYFKNKAKNPSTGSTKLTLPFGPDGQLVPADPSKWLVEENGDTIWYNEPELLEKIETRVGETIPVLDPRDLSVRGIIDSPMDPELRKKRKPEADEEEANQEPASRRGQKRKVEQPKAVVYGSKKKDAASVACAKNLVAIKPMVGVLEKLETQVQQMFARAMWGAVHTSTPTPAGIATADTAGLVKASVSGGAPMQLKSDGGPPEADAGEPPAKKAKKKMRW